MEIFHIKLLIEDTSTAKILSMAGDGIHPKQCFALNCGTDKDRPHADPHEIAPANICNDLASFKKLVTTAIRTTADKCILFFGYSINTPVAIRMYICALLDEWKQSGHYTIVVVTDNIELHDPIFYWMFNLHACNDIPDRKHYCSRCCQQRTQKYVIHCWYPTNKTIVDEERCELCNNVRNKDLPNGGLRRDQCDCRHPEDIPIYCITCRHKVAEYVVWDNTLPTDNAWITKEVNGEMSQAQYIYCSMECRKIGKTARHHPHTCWVCQKPGKACGGCEKIYYCSVECQKSDRARHKPVCQ